MEQGRNTLLYLLLYGQLSDIHILMNFRLWPFRRRAFIWKAIDLKRKNAFNQFKFMFIVTFLKYRGILRITSDF